MDKGGNDMDSIRQEVFDALSDAVVCMDSAASVLWSSRALDMGIPASDAIECGLSRGMERVGELYDRGEYFVPEIVVCADALYAGMGVLKTALPRSPQPRTRIVAGVVEGDTHDIGKNIVVTMLDAAGFEVYDLGRNVPLGEFTRKALDVDADVVALSALVTTTMQGMIPVIREIREASTDRYRYVIVGGAPVSQAFADRIGADGYAPSAPGAVRLVRALMGREVRP